MKTITVFTPTYNRAYCLHKCYESMKRQSCYDFDWLIIDDGSSDNTKELVDQWIQEDNPFDIKYVYKENGGMHTGYNTAYSLIKTELAMNVDSDDYLTDTAIEDIITFWNKNKRDDVGGIYALDRYENGEVIGTSFPEDLKEFHGWGYKILFYEVNGVKKKYVNAGDKKFIGVTKIINEYPSIPVYEGEKFFTLYYKQHLIERDYSILIMNKPVCVVEYMGDSITNNMYKQYFNNTEGFREERNYVMKNAPSFKLRYHDAIHYVAESFIAKDKKFIHHSSNKGIVLLALPLGIPLFFYLKYKTKEVTS